MAFQHEQQKLHHCRSPDLAILPGILRRLDGTRCQLHLSLHRTRYNDDEEVYQRIAFEIMDTIERTGFPLTELCVGDTPLAISKNIIAAWSLGMSELRALRLRESTNLHRSDVQQLLQIVGGAKELKSFEASLGRHLP